MFTKWSLAFEGASVLLLSTAVGVLVLAKRERPAAASQPPIADARTGKDEAA